MQMIEPIIATYRVSSQGCMMRTNEATIPMGRKFFSANDGNMTLTRSTDKRVISLVNFDSDNVDGEFFKLMAWSIKLKTFDIPEEVNISLSNYYRDNLSFFKRLVEVQMVFNCKMVMMTYIEIKDRSIEEQ